MYCSSCGKQMPGVRWRCPACRVFTGAFWLNIFLLSLWAVIVAANWLYLDQLFPGILNIATSLGRALNLPMRIHFGLSDLAKTYGLLVIGLGIVLLLVLWWRKVSLPGFLKSGKLLAVVTWVVLVGSLGGFLAGLVESQGQTVEFLRGLPSLEDTNDTATVNLLLGNYAKALVMFNEQRAVRTLWPHRGSPAYSAVMLGEAFRGLGDVEQARQYYKEALELSQPAKRIGPVKRTELFAELAQKRLTALGPEKPQAKPKAPAKK